MQKQKVKIGFGSSAALCVAVVFGVCRFHKIKLSEFETFKLATLAHFFAQGKIGSGFDVAASALGGVILYKRFDGKFLKENKAKPVSWFVEKEWPNLEIKKISFPKSLKFLVVFSGKKADTKELVNKMNEFKEKKKQEYFYIIEAVSDVTKNLLFALENEEKEKILEYVNENRLLLKRLGEESKTNLETPELTQIIETAKNFEASAKFCGAGGGDSAICVAFEQKKLDALKKALNKKGFTTIDTRISLNGVKAYA